MRWHETLLTACSNSDTVAHDGDPDYMEDYVTPPTQPTEDALQVKLADGTYVFSGNYTGEAKALVDRVTVPDTGSYTIVWRQTDVDANSDREEFTFHMSK